MFAKNRYANLKVFNKLFFVSLVAVILSACGAQTTATGNTVDSTAVPSSGSVAAVDVSFSKDILPLFQEHCVNCHGGEKTSRGLKLTSFDNAMAGSNNGAMIIAGDPDKSKLFQLVQQGKMPKRGGKLSAAQVEILKEWIKAGAQNN